MSNNRLRIELTGNDQITIESMLNVAMDSNFSSIMLTSASDGYQIKYVNPAFTELTGYMPEEVIGKDPSLLQGPKTDRSLLTQLREKLNSGDTFHGKTVNYRKDGSEFMMEWKIYPIKNADQQTTFFMAVQRGG
ncbi:MAG: PAS domain S-box protein [Desulfobacterales bacterium]|nr:PAS domain S-box protein [Desulfobacterales bacterium]